MPIISIFSQTAQPVAEFRQELQVNANMEDALTHAAIPIAKDILDGPSEEELAELVEQENEKRRSRDNKKNPVESVSTDADKPPV